MVYWEAIMSATQDSNAQEPNFGGNLSLAQDIWYTAWQMSHVTGLWVPTAFFLIASSQW